MELPPYLDYLYTYIYIYIYNALYIITSKKKIYTRDRKKLSGKTTNKMQMHGAVKSVRSINMSRGIFEYETHRRFQNQQNDLPRHQVSLPRLLFTSLSRVAQGLEGREMRDTKGLALFQLLYAPR